jgi:hypothetical protein
MKILGIKLFHKLDDDPDLSWLGEFHDGDRKKFDMEPVENRVGCMFETLWFTPGPNHWPHNPKSWDHVSQEEKDKVIAKYGSLKKADFEYARADRDRLVKFYQNKWSMLGIGAEARILITDIVQTITSSYLWGIESDAGKDYHQEVEQEQLSELRYELSELGFSMLQLDEAFTKVEQKELV